METESRDQLTSQSLKSRNEKIADVIESSEVFIEKINDSKAKFEKLKPFEENCEKAALEGNDISVCVRVRPMLEHEKQAKYLKPYMPTSLTFMLLKPSLESKVMLE